MGSLNLNWKLASAFATGAVLASGIVYFAVRPQDVPTREVARDAPRPPVPVSKKPDAIPGSVLEKPSPMPAPARPRKQVFVARNNPPPAPPPAVEPKPELPPAPPTPAAPVVPPAPAENVPVQNVSLPAPNAPPPVSEARVPHTVTLTAGTTLPVRIGEKLSSAHNQVGDIFLATLTQPLVIDGWVIAERGARAEGRVVDTTPAGRVKGVAHLGISIVRLATADGQNIRIRTEPYVQDGPTSTGTDAAKIGAGAAIGAIIGALAGGGKGAGIGAGAGGATGTGDVLLTRGKPAEIPVETRVSFKVQESVTITERLD